MQANELLPRIFTKRDLEHLQYLLSKAYETTGDKAYSQAHYVNECKIHALRMRGEW